MRSEKKVVGCLQESYLRSSERVSLGIFGPEVILGTVAMMIKSIEMTEWRDGKNLGPE